MTTALAARPGADFKLDPERWHAQRAQGVTATQVRDLAKGGASDRKRIMSEKLTGKREDLSGNKYVAHGNEREPVIAEWIMGRFGIAPSDVLFQHPKVDRYLATPDGVKRDPFSGKAVVSEIKTSKHDLTPGIIVDNVFTPRRSKQGRVVLDTKLHFASTGYYDQMQFQMFVMDADECLFVWETHDDFVPREIKWCWVLRDDQRISELVAIADDFLSALDRARQTPPEIDAQLAEIVGEDAPQESDERAELARQVIRGREIEAEGKALKEAAWKRLQELAEASGDFSAEYGDVNVSYTTTTKAVDVFDEAEAKRRAPKTFEQWEKLRARYTKPQARTSRTLNVTKPKANV